MKVLIACEYSGIEREAFKAMGHQAVSCDLLDTEIPGDHYKGDVRDIINDGWDLMVAHPPCTRLARSGARWWPLYLDEQKEAIKFFMDLINAKVPRIALENPIGIMSRLYREPDQIIQPWQYGHGETKATCLWLKNLPRLIPTNIVDGREHRVHEMQPGPDRWKERSRSYPGIAQAMAGQWAGNMTRQATLEIIKVYE